LALAIALVSSALGQETPPPEPLSGKVLAELLRGNSDRSQQPGSHAARYPGEPQFFGIRGSGDSFVFVCDRSGSMADLDGKPLAALKAELRLALTSLRSVQSFQILFYNQRVRYLQLAREEQPQLLFSSDDGLKLADRFIESVTPDGATDHVQAMKSALSMGPDTVFFFTDNGEPALTAEDVARIERSNRGSVIHAIEWGSGPARFKTSPLQRLAERTSGKYVYVDVSQPAE
jgi:hypothetical protein